MSRPDYNFKEMKILPESELTNIGNPELKVKVLDEKHVEYNSKSYLLSQIKDQLKLTKSPCGNWVYKSKSLSAIYTETCGPEDADDLTSVDILEALKNEIIINYQSKFSIPDPDKNSSTFLWIGDNKGLIGDWPYHYEVEISECSNNKFGHDGKHAFVELHIGETKTATIGKCFSEVVTEIQKNEEIKGFPWKGKDVVNSLRLKRGANGHSFNEPNLIKNIIKELIELDKIVGDKIRSCVSLYERPDRYKKLIEEYKKILSKNKGFIDNELYKWQFITECKDKSVDKIVEYCINKNLNLVDGPRVFPGWKDIVKDNPQAFYEVINKVVDNSIDLSVRLENFKIEMNKLFAPYPKYKNFANDERTASCFIGCKYPEQYTFYKDELLYAPFCNYLGVEKEKAGKKYQHFIELLKGLERLLKKYTELIEAIGKKTRKHVSSTLLIAQNICWCVFSKEGQKYLGDKIMSNKPEELEKYTKILSNKKNVILQGAPGTGKTYTTASLALSICGIDEIDYSNRDEVMEKYKELREDGRIGFCTFHQSMDYEDFIEGLRPATTEQGIVYRPEPGLFKIMCERASGVEDIDIVDAIDKYIASIEGSDNKKTIPTLTGKSSLYVWHNKDNTTISTRSTLTKIDKDSEYSPSPLNIEKIKAQATGEGEENNWRYYAQAFINAVKKEYNLDKPKTSDVPYVLIIDEINRGYVSKIFGELITLLEAAKRLGTPKTELTVELPYSKEKFGIPKNLYIIGTMNTTDRSTGSIDYAVRRRFAFITLESKKQVLIDNDCIQQSQDLFDDVSSFLLKEKLQDIDFNDLMVGHSYFMAKDEDKLMMKMEYEVIPLIKEYIKDGLLKCTPAKAEKYFNDWLKLKVHSEESLIQTQTNNGMNDDNH